MSHGSRPSKQRWGSDSPVVLVLGPWSPFLSQVAPGGTQLTSSGESPRGPGPLGSMWLLQKPVASRVFSDVWRHWWFLFYRVPSPLELHVTAPQRPARPVGVGQEVEASEETVGWTCSTGSGHIVLPGTFSWRWHDGVRLVQDEEAALLLVTHVCTVSASHPLTPDGAPGCYVQTCATTGNRRGSGGVPGGWPARLRTGGLIPVTLVLCLTLRVAARVASGLGGPGASSSRPHRESSGLMFVASCSQGGRCAWNTLPRSKGRAQRAQGAAGGICLLS